MSEDSRPHDSAKLRGHIAGWTPSLPEPAHYRPNLWLLFGAILLGSLIGWLVVQL